MIRLLAALLVLSLPSLANADTMELDQLIERVRTRNPSAAAAVVRVEAARLRVPRARAFLEPYLQTMVEDVPPRLSGGMPMVRFQISQMFHWPGKRDRMAAVADREADAIAARAAATMFDVVLEAKRIYHQLLLNRESQRINREQRAIVDTVVDIATARLGSGTGMHHDVLKMQTEASMLDDGLLMLEMDRREMTAMVNALLDVPADAKVADPVPAWTPALSLSRQRIVQLALDRRPELREMAAMQQAERAMADAAKREYYPDVMLGGLYDLRMNGESSIGAMVGLNLPIWIGSRQGLDVRAAQTRARSIGLDRNAMAAMARAEIERHLARIEASDRRVRLLESEFIPRAQQTFDSAVAAFPSGRVDALELLDALRAVSTQKLSLVALRVERELALADLERATGAPTKELSR